MKQLQLIGFVVCAASLIGCETTGTAGMGNQEQKRLAAIQKENEESAQISDADRNLWNTQMDRMNKDSNPGIRY